MQRFFRENGLTLTLMFLFSMTFCGQILTGREDYNDNRQDHGKPPVELSEYLTSGHFIEVTFENWESEFLQMGMFVLLTIWLRQKGSSESKTMDEKEEVDREPDPTKEDAPWAVKRGGWIVWVYGNSLSIALFVLFIISFFFHASGGARAYSEEQLEQGKAAVTTVEYMTTSRFWFESFQNWQSEFFSIAILITFTIFLRQKGSPQSKPVDASHDETGE
jgi:hypothetical protein